MQTRFYHPTNLSFKSHIYNDNSTKQTVNLNVPGNNKDQLKRKVPLEALKANFLSRLSFKGDSKLESNLKIAQEAFDYVANLNLLSSTKMEMNNQTRGENCEDYEKSIRDRMFLDRKRKNLPIDEFIATTKELVPLLRVGNCSEQAILAATYLKENKHIDNFALVAAIEVSDKESFAANPLKYSYNARNHVFVVLDPAKDASLNDPSTWGKDAVILDPWGNICAPALLNNSEAKTGIEQITELGLFARNKDVEFMNYAPFIDPTKDPESSYNWENSQKEI